MPYIKRNDRYELGEELRKPESAGELNYLISILIDDYLMDGEYNYQTMNDIIGALEGAKLEFYRRIVVPYEDSKRSENGDVYTAL